MQISALRHRLLRLAADDGPVLLTDGTRASAHLAARCLHRLSVRRLEPFLSIDCAAHSAWEIESRLFGYERGAFRAAERAFRGGLEVCAAGILFLEGIDALSSTLQDALCCVLARRSFTRFGGSQTLPMHGRMLTASRADLRRRVELGDFSRDLYTRLEKSRVALPRKRSSQAEAPAPLPQIAREVLAGRMFVGRSDRIPACIDSSRGSTAISLARSAPTFASRSVKERSGRGSKTSSQPQS